MSTRSASFDYRATCTADHVSAFPLCTRLLFFVIFSCSSSSSAQSSSVYGGEKVARPSYAVLSRPVATTSRAYQPPHVTFVVRSRMRDLSVARERILHAPRAVCAATDSPSGSLFGTICTRIFQSVAPRTWKKVITVQCKFLILPKGKRKEFFLVSEPKVD